MKQILLAAIFMTLLAPCCALAQSTPTSAPSASIEDAQETTAAKAFYTSLVAGNPDRSKISSELNDALTDSLVKTLASQLTALGDPTWTFEGRITLPDGPIQRYKLTYASGAIVHYSYGVTAKGTIFAAAFRNG